MRVLALDIGDVRTGIAVCDPGMKVASPVCVLPTSEVMVCSKSFRAVLDDWEPELLLCGLPVSLDGREGQQAAHIREMAQMISAACSIPCEFTDERLSSQEAKRSLRDSGYDEKRMRGRIDMVAASLFLQKWLDEHARNELER